MELGKASEEMHIAINPNNGIKWQARIYQKYGVDLLKNFKNTFSRFMPLKMVPTIKRDRRGVSANNTFSGFRDASGTPMIQQIPKIM